jgi:hypothetical protein
MLKAVSRASSADEVIASVHAFYKGILTFGRTCWLQEVVWWCMVVINNSIAMGAFADAKYLVDHGIIAAVVPLCASLSAKLRLQALWILGNLGVSDGEKGFKSVVVSHAIVTDIVKVS